MNGRHAAPYDAAASWRDLCPQQAPRHRSVTGDDLDEWAARRVEHPEDARPADPCTCSWWSEDRGGCYSEIVGERDPDCPSHGDPAAAAEPLEAGRSAAGGTSIPMGPETPGTGEGETRPPVVRVTRAAGCSCSLCTMVDALKAP